MGAILICRTGSHGTSEGTSDFLDLLNVHGNLYVPSLISTNGVSADVPSPLSQSGGYNCVSYIIILHILSKWLRFYTCN